MKWLISAILCVQFMIIFGDNIICPGGSICPDGTTCCPGPEGYKCCPMQNAVCCDDGFHCCPHNKACEFETGRCIDKKQELISLVFGRKMKLTPLKSNSIMVAYSSTNEVFCKDGSHCDQDTTCCEGALGNWGCCDFPNAVCCPDQQHCCPFNHVCSPNNDLCIPKQDIVIPHNIKI